MFDVLKQLWLFIFKSNVEEGIQALAVRLRWHQRLLLAALVGIGLLFWVTNGRAFDPLYYVGQLIYARFDNNNLPREVEYRQSLSRVAKIAEPLMAERASTWMREARKSEDGFTWGVAQLVAASPNASRENFEEFEEFLREQYSSECKCFLYDGVPHTITLSAVLLAYARHESPVPPAYIDTLMAAQANPGWWSATLDATGSQSNASIHATVWAVLALQECLEDLEEGSARRLSIEARVFRAIAWLRLTIPRSGEGWSDYPSNDRSVSDPLFAGMIALAAARIGDADLVRSTSQFENGAEITSPLLTVSSDAFVERKSGAIYIDRYRHLPFIWRAMPLIVGYSKIDSYQKVNINNAMENLFQISTNNQSLVRQEWVLAEFILVNSIVLDKNFNKRISK